MKCDKPLIFCPIHGRGCDDSSCDGTLSVNMHDDFNEHEDGETRHFLVCLKSDQPYEIPNPYTTEEINALIDAYKSATQQSHDAVPYFTSPTRSKPSRRKQKRGRQGSGLKGKKTKYMDKQLSNFKTWLIAHPINEHKHGCTIGERANQFWNSRKKTFEKASERQGEKRGYSCAKTLASAYRNS